MKPFHDNIYGWSSEGDQLVLLKTILPLLKSKPIKIAEIGVLCGKLTAMWVVELLNSNIEFEYYAVDHFLPCGLYKEDTYEATIKNLEPIINHVKIIKEMSEKASQLFNDEYFDIVYIDASHDYENVKKDINCWFPKVKKECFLCGDDYIGGWAGVMAAVNERFPSIKVVGGQQWLHQKLYQKPNPCPSG